jgi:hypothetical protein
MIIFMPSEIYTILFEKQFNNVNDYNDPKFTGGIEYVFNPFRHFKCRKV